MFMLAFQTLPERLKDQYFHLIICLMWVYDDPGKGRHICIGEGVSQSVIECGRV